MTFLLRLLIVGMTLAVVGVMAFFAWFTLAFFSVGSASLAAASVFFAVGVATLLYGFDRVRKLRRGERVRI